jgi:hypothetical protein
LKSYQNVVAKPFMNPAGMPGKSLLAKDGSTFHFPTMLEPFEEQPARIANAATATDKGRFIA